MFTKLQENRVVAIARYYSLQLRIRNQYNTVYISPSMSSCRFYQNFDLNYQKSSPDAPPCSAYMYMHTLSAFIASKRRSKPPPEQALPTMQSPKLEWANLPSWRTVCSRAALMFSSLLLASSFGQQLLSYPWRMRGLPSLSLPLQSLLLVPCPVGLSLACRLPRSKLLHPHLTLTQSQPSFEPSSPFPARNFKPKLSHGPYNPTKLLASNTHPQHMP